MLSQTYVSAIIVLLAEILPRMGLVIGNDKLTSLIQAVAIIVGGIWIMVRRYRQGDISAVGVKQG